MRRQRAAITALAVLTVAIVAAVITIVVVGLRTGSGTDTSTSAAAEYAPQPSRVFFWGFARPGTFTPMQRAEIARTRGIAVIAPHHDGYDLAVQEREGRILKKLNPHLKVLFYFNSKHYLSQTLFPKYMTGFDPATMALHDESGALIPYKPNDNFPDGIGDYVDNRSATWRDFFVRTAQQIMQAGHFDGIAIDDLDSLAAPANATVLDALPPDQITAWRAGQLQLLRQVKATFPDKTVLYNGISPIKYDFSNRDLEPLQTADAAVNESYCLQITHTTGGNTPALRRYVAPARKNILTEMAMMRSAAKAHKIILETVNFFEDNAGIERYGDLCAAAFLISYQPGSTYFDVSSGYKIDQLDKTPKAINLKLGAPSGQGSVDGSTLHRSFRRGDVYANVGTSPVSVTVTHSSDMIRDGRAVGRLHAGAQLTLAPMSSAFLLKDSSSLGFHGGLTP